MNFRLPRFVLQLLIVAVFPTAAAAESNRLFTRTGSMQVMRDGHRATPLGNGQVLITGGTSNGQSLATAELFDPAAGTFRLLASTLHSPRGLHTMTELPDGKILIAGGFAAPSAPASTASAELFDPKTETFTLVGPMTAERGGHTATLLPNGKVLLTGGSNSSGTLATAELFDPELGTFTAVAAMAAPRAYHCATALLDGRILITGGWPGGQTNTAELFDSTSRNFTPASAEPMNVARHQHTATLLPDGRVLVAGGASFGQTSDAVATAELYDPATQRFTVSNGQSRRRNHAAVLLPNGQVLLTGGNPSYFRSETADLYDSTTDRMVRLFPHTMNEMRERPSATLLPGGQVLIVGGGTGQQPFQDDPAGNTAEIFDPQKIGSATANQVLLLVQRLPDGRVRFTGKTTARRTVSIETAVHGVPNSGGMWGVIGFPAADENGVFQLEWAAGSATHGFFRLRLPE